MNRKKLAIVVGHNSLSQGAMRQDTGESEFVWNSRLARMIEDAAEGFGLAARVFFREPAGDYTQEIREVYGRVDAWGAAASVELHFNAAESAEATGTETLSSGTPGSLRLATAVQREMVAALGLRDRGVKTRAAKERGGGALHSGRAPAILIEPFFATSRRGLAASDTDAEKQAIAEAVLHGAAEALDAMPRVDIAESRTIKAVEVQRKGQALQAITGTAAAIGGLATALRDELQALANVGALEPYLPTILAVLGLVAVCATVLQRSQSDRIEAARLDDHERGRR